MPFLKSPLKLLIALTLILTFSTFSFGQETKFDLQLDTLSGIEIMRIQRDSKFPTIKFDSVRIELFYKGENLATIPVSLSHQINKKFILSTDYEIEKLIDKRVLLKIKHTLTFK